MTTIIRPGQRRHYYIRRDGTTCEARQLPPAAQADLNARIAAHAQRVAAELQAIEEAHAQVRERARRLTAPRRKGPKGRTGEAFKEGGRCQ